MTVEHPDNWLAPLPMDEYLASVKKTTPAAIPEPHSCPNDYKINDHSIACGPLVRFLATHEENKPNYRGTILLVIRDFETAGGVPPVSFILGSCKEDTNSEFANEAATKSEIIHSEECFTFIRYAFEFELQPYEQKVKYTVDNVSLPHFQFFIPSSQQSMNVMSYSCNGFSLGTETATFNGSLWLDVLRKHDRSNFHYHVMIGGGDQIYADSVKNTSEEFAHWLKHKHIHSTDKLTPKIKDSFDNYYLNRYVEWFGKGYWVGSAGKTIQSMLPIALATIPQVNIYDDHDIIDGFGSYADITMRQEIFQGLGREAFKYYMLFQHHTYYDESPDLEPSWIAGNKEGPYINQLSRSIYARLGKSIGLLALDCRTERTKHQVVFPDTYNKVFDRVESEILSSKQYNKPIKHLYVLLGIPICYPRMVFIEKIMGSPLIRPILYLARKGIIAHGLVNEFDGQVELLDDLNDHWCAHHHKRERNQLMNRLIAFGEKHDVRITVLSGDVHLSCISRFRGNSEAAKKRPENDPQFILNLISSAIVNTPPPDGMVKFLSMRAKKHIFGKSAVEDMVPLFKTEPGSSEHRLHDMFMNKRNYSDLIPISNLSDEYLHKHFGGDTKDKFYVPGTVVQGLKTLTLNENVSASKKTNGDIGYPFDEDGVVATLHVEIDRTSSASNTDDYEILVPSLTVKH